MSRVLITMVGKDTKTLAYDNVRSMTIINSGRRYLVMPTRIDVNTSDGNSNVIRIRTRNGVHDLPIDWDYKYILVWYDGDDSIIAHVDVDGRFVHVSIRAWP